MPDPTPDRGPAIAIFCVSAAVLLFQIALTRVLSVVAWYHFAFLTLSLVMLGLGAPGIWFSFIKRPQRWLGPALLAGGVLLPVATAVVVGRTVLALTDATGLMVLATLPGLVALGSAVCLLLMRAEGSRIGRMYAWDLAGACLGAVLAIPLMHALPTPTLAAACGLLPLAGAAALGGPWRLPAGILAAGLVAALAVTDLFDVTHSKSHDETALAPLAELWTPTARLTVYGEGYAFLDQFGDGFAWGRGTEAPTDAAPEQLWLEQDGHAGTPITRFDGDLAPVQHLLYDVTTVGYQLRPPQAVTIIGAGGGRDILSALLRGATDIEAVELNPATIALVSEDFAALSGDIYHRPGVTAVASEGRSHLTHSDRPVDLLQISLIDSWAASTAGAYALAENSLYTVEAFGLYLDRLTPFGVLSTSRWESELPRLLILARAALAEHGAKRPEDHLLVVSAGEVVTLLASPSPWMKADHAALAEIAAERGFQLRYPGEGGRIAELAEGRTEALAAAGLNVRPPTDDSPYFFQVQSPFAPPLDDPALAGLPMNTESTEVLRQLIRRVTLAALFLFGLPFVLPQVRRALDDGTPALPGSAYFAAIGAGFMLWEAVLIQHFVLYLGHPSRAVSVVLAALLAGMGLGAALSPRVGPAALRRFGLAVPALVAAAAFALPWLFQATLATPLAARIAGSLVLLVPLGAALGLWFPGGMVHFGERRKAWHWAVNGFFGVLAAVLSLALSMAWGYRLVGLVAAACYAVAWICLWSRATAR